MDSALAMESGENRAPGCSDQQSGGAAADSALTAAFRRYGDSGLDDDWQPVDTFLRPRIRGLLHAVLITKRKLGGVDLELLTSMSLQEIKKAARNYRGDAKVFTYCSTIALRVSSRAHDKQKPPLVKPPDDSSADDAFSEFRQELVEVVREVIEALFVVQPWNGKPKLRSAWDLYYREQRGEMPWAKVAEAVSASVGTVNREVAEFRHALIAELKRRGHLKGDVSDEKLWRLWRFVYESVE